MMRNRQLIVNYSQQELRSEDIKTYLKGLIQGDHKIKKGKSKGKKRSRRLLLTLHNIKDYTNLVGTRHTLNGFSFTVKPTLTKAERIEIIRSKLKRRLYLNNLPLDIAHQDLKDLFGKFDKIAEIFIKKKNSDNSGKEYVLAFVTFESIAGFNRCVNAGPMYYKGVEVGLMEVGSASPSSSDSGNLIKVDDSNLRPVVRSSGGNPNHSGFDSRHSSSNQSLSLPFVSVSSRASLRSDWMGHKIRDKFSISRLVLSEQEKLERMRADRRAVCGSDYNLRLHLPKFKRDQMRWKSSNYTQHYYGNYSARPRSPGMSTVGWPYC